jgi:hypothetical protein
MTRPLTEEEFIAQLRPGARIELTLALPQPTTVVSLQAEGACPVTPPWCASAIIPDRNVVATLDRMRNGLAVPVADQHWLHQLNSRAYRFAPVASAFEGRTRRPVSFGEFAAEYEFGLQVVASALPEAQLLRLDQDELQAMFDRQSATRATRQAEAKFFMAVAPLLTTRAARHRLRRTEAQVLAQADAHNVKRDTFALIVAMSCLYEPDEGNIPPIGRRVLKPSLTYSDEQAHNAVSDIDALEVLAMLVHVKNRNFGLCTRDQALAELWKGAQLSQGEKDANGDHALHMNPAPWLFARLSANEAAAMKDRAFRGGARPEAIG